MFFLEITTYPIILYEIMLYNFLDLLHALFLVYHTKYGVGDIVIAHVKSSVV